MMSTSPQCRGVTYPTVWRFPGPTSPVAWAVLPAVVVVLSSVTEEAAQQEAVW
jgi:hypothetical protein